MYVSLLINRLSIKMLPFSSTFDITSLFRSICFQTVERRLLAPAHYTRSIPSKILFILSSVVYDKNTCIKFLSIALCTIFEYLHDTKKCSDQTKYQLTLCRQNYGMMQSPAPCLSMNFLDTDLLHCIYRLYFGPSDSFICAVYSSCKCKQAMRAFRLNDELGWYCLVQITIYI